MTITDKGSLYSLDVLFSVLIVSIILAITVAHVSGYTVARTDSFKYKQLETQALFLADSLIKNNDANGLYGIAVYDEQTHRVKSHTVREKDSVFLKNNPDIHAVWVQDGNTVHSVFDRNTSTDCIGVERFVVVDGKKKVLGVRVCA